MSGCVCPVQNARSSGRRPNPLRLDPTRTTMLRNQMMAEMRKRFGQLRRDIIQLVDAEDAFGLRANEKAGTFTIPEKGPRTYETRTTPLDMILNTRWRFDTDDAKIEAYHKWLGDQVKSGVLEVSPGLEAAPWTDTYIKSSYKKGVMRAYTDTHAEKIAAGAGNFDFIQGGQAAFLDQAFNAPIAQGKLKLLQTRTFSQLKGVTAQMDQEMSRILADGIAHGKGPRELARELTKSVDTITKKRALVIARTEIVNAHNEGQLDSFEAMGAEGVSIQAEWNTAHDGEVCPLCEPMEGVVLSIKEARGMLPRHPNCMAGDMRVLAPGTLAMLQTHYTGEIIELVTVGGRHVTVTPAHVLLTKYGFTRAESVYNGLDLVIDLGFYGGCEAPDYKNAVACIADEFVSAAEACDVTTISVPTAPEHLHGEGGFCNKEINIVFSNGILGDSRKTNIGKPHLYGTLPFVTAGLSHDTLCSLTQIFLSAARAADGSMGCCRDALAFFLSRILETNQVRLGAGTGLQANVCHSFIDYVSINMKLLRDCLDRHTVLKKLNDFSDINLRAILAGSVPDFASGLVEAGFDGIPFDPVMFGNLVEGPFLGNVQFDKVAGVERHHVFSFPVYDIQTLSTLYSINGVITSNCRCAWVPAGVGEEEGGTTKTQWAGPEQGLEVPGTLPTGKTTGQTWGKDAAKAAIRESVEAEHPALPAAAARKASRWAGADLTSITQKLKPGSKAAVK